MKKNPSAVNFLKICQNYGLVPAETICKFMRNQWAFNNFPKLLKAHCPKDFDSLTFNKEIIKYH